MATCVSTADFDQIFEDFKRTVSYKVMTKTTDSMTGDETTTFAAASNVDLVFFREDTRYMFDKEGLLEVGDGYLMAKLTTGIKRYDQFTIDSKTYYIENVTRRYVAGVAMMDYAICFFVA